MSSKRIGAVMYEVNWHSIDDMFSHCTVTAITILREGVIPGCAGISITAKDIDGCEFLGSPDNYYATEEAAWEAVKSELVESIEARVELLAKLQTRLTAEREYLKKLTTNGDSHNVQGSPDRIHPENRRDPRVVVVDRDGEQLQWGELGAGSFGQVGDTTLSEHVLGKIEERVRAGENGGVVWVDGIEYVFVAGG